jgi:hypothetical protein
MTISSTTVKNSYNGDGSTATFTYTFKIFADSDLQVIIRSALGTETVKTLTTHYTVTGAGVSIWWFSYHLLLVIFQHLVKQLY